MLPKGRKRPAAGQATFGRGPFGERTLRGEDPSGRDPGKRTRRCRKGGSTRTRSLLIGAEVGADEDRRLLTLAAIGRGRREGWGRGAGPWPQAARRLLAGAGGWPRA